MDEQTPYATIGQLGHPIVDVLIEDGRSIKWLARKIRYSYIHTWQATHGIVPAGAKFRKRCADLLSMPEAELFLDLSEPVLAS